MISTLGMSLGTLGEYHEYTGGVQYSGGYHEYARVYHEYAGGTMMNVGDIIRCSVHWRKP